MKSILLLMSEPVNEERGEKIAGEKDRLEKTAWKKFGDMCNSKLEEHSSEVRHLLLETENGKGYCVERLILKNLEKVDREDLFFVIEKILPSQDLPDMDFVNEIHLTKVSPFGKTFTAAGYKYDASGVVYFTPGEDAIVPKTVKILQANNDEGNSISKMGVYETNWLTEKIARSTPSSGLEKFNFTRDMTNDEYSRLSQDEDDEWFEAQREHFRRMEDPEDPFPDGKWKQEVQDEAIKIAERDGRGAPEEADFNTAIIHLGDKIPKEVRQQLNRDLRAIEEGRSSDDY